VAVAGELSRRDFLEIALATGAAVALPVTAGACGAGAAPATSTEPGGGYFLTDSEGHPRRSTCEALCARIVPTGADPRMDPGATEARAVDFIDIYLAAFELPAAVADNPAIWLRGRYSGREPYPDNENGTPSRSYPPSDFVTPGGQRRFMPLTPFQRISWRSTLYGKEALEEAHVSQRWLSQVGNLIPAPNVMPLRQMYLEGLDAFEDYSKSRFGSSVAALDAHRRDDLLAAAAGTATGVPSPPGAASALFPQLVVHTFQACYSLPEYGGNHDRVMWKLIGWDGDTQPLGNSIYDASLAGPGEGPNRGFGDPAVYQPRGGYREYRAVSGPDSAGATD
jgi:hypothetical protein